MDKSVLCIIPARGGSKGVPRKNVKLLNDKPLIVYTIEAILQSSLSQICRVLVSTEDTEIASVAMEAGAEVPFLRPVELAQDQTTGNDVIDHVLDELNRTEGYQPDYIMILQPTSPVRLSTDIECAFEIASNEVCDAVISVTKVKEHPLIMRSIDQNGYIRDILPNHEGITRRQDFQDIYRFNGAIYIAKLTAWNQYHNFVSMSNVLPYIMPQERSIDIDDFMDWQIAEILIKEVSKNEVE